MRFSENWLRTFVDPPLTTRELADALTMSGLEVENIEPAAPVLGNIVVGEVLAVRRHPHAERLSICTVGAGGDPLQVVCGAPNVRAGMRAPLARSGAHLAGVTVQRTAIRGVDSNGMLCSTRDLGIGEDTSALLELPDDAPVGADIRAYLELDDQILTVKPTPNRGDCLSVQGVAREVAAVTGSTLKRMRAIVEARRGDRVDITLEVPEACPRYCGRIVRDINAGAATPRWMAQRLERSGTRSISAVVDITNYVMLELGQPLHAFDLIALEGGIRVRCGRAGEQLMLLNDQRIALGPDWLVIADQGKPLALAGIMGGKDSAVTADTQDILLESAFFAPAVIAGKSRLLGFGSESAYRFERGVDFAATREALERATQLVLELCGGEAGPVSEASAELPARRPVRVRRARAQRVLGTELTSGDVSDALRRLRFEFEARGDHFDVTPPSYRFDLAIEEDLIEEIARIHGYDRIPASRPAAAAVMLPASELSTSAGALRALLVARDYQEIISYSFVGRQSEIDFCDNREPVSLINPIAAHLEVMRSSLIGSFVECLKLNLSRQQERVRLFEIGRCFARTATGYSQQTKIGGLAYGGAVPAQWGSPARMIDFYDVKSDVEALLGRRGARYEPFKHPALHPGRSAKVTLGGVEIGCLGTLHPQLLQKYDFPYAPVVFELNLDAVECRVRARFSDFSRLPLVRRDLAVEVAATISAETMLDALQKGAPEIVSDIVLFDVYRGKGIDSDKKSIAFRILLQDTLKTLTDAEVEAAIQQLLHVLQEEFQAKLRN